MKVLFYTFASLTLLGSSRSDNCSFGVTDGCNCSSDQTLVTVRCTDVNISTQLVVGDVVDIQLHHLDLSSNNLSDISITFIQGLSQISNLDLSFNSFETYPPVLNGLNVSRITFSHNKFKILDLDKIDANNQLKSLELSFNNISNIKETESQVSIPKLNLSNNHLTDIPNVVWKSVQDLDLSFNSELSKLSVTSKSPIKELKLTGNRMESVPSFGAHFQSLEKLVLNMNNLQTFSITSFKGLSALTELDLANNNIHDLSSGFLQGLKTLTELNLQGNKISHIPVHSIPEGEMQWLSFSKNNVSSIDPLAFKNMKNLRHLDLSDNPSLSDIKRVDFPNHLIYLDLSHCSLTVLEDCKLINHIDLMFLGLDGNHLECSCHLSWLYKRQMYMQQESFLSKVGSHQKWKCLNNNKYRTLTPDFGNCSASSNTKHCSNGMLLPNPDLIDLKMSVKAEDEVITATWSMEPKDNIHGFIVTYDTKDNTIFESPLLGRSISTYVIKDMRVEGSYTICVHALLNETYTLKKTCYQENDDIIQMVIGILAGVVFLVPCIVALMYIIYKDHVIMKEVEYEYVPDLEKVTIIPQEVKDNDDGLKGNGSKVKDNGFKDNSSNVNDGSKVKDSCVKVKANESNVNTDIQVKVKEPLSLGDSNQTVEVQALEVHHEQTNSSFVSDCGHIHKEDEIDECPKADPSDAQNTKL